jgi:predicted transglutaminase-like cysteine proteinase|tara:strand:+ start:633 stop:926 length:294 start_codon:yes stop_codon:yes gene_type:complete
LEGNGDDCDGLSAPPYNALIMKGFPSNQIYYGLIRNKYNGSHHMVTFWFDKSDDPYVIDSVGTASNGLKRMSDVKDWQPLRIFSEERDYLITPIPSH